MIATKTEYNKTRVAREFRNTLTGEGAQMVYFLSKSHTVILRRGADDQVIARLDTIEAARNTWARWQASIESQGFSKIK